MENYLSKEIFEAEYQAVYHYVLGLCKNNTQAQDITQETFVKALNGFSKFKEESSLYTWLCAIAKNIWLSQYREKKKELDLLDTFSVENELENKLVEKEIAFQIHVVLHSLKEPYKEVFSLRTFGELSFVEIGKLFGKSDSWARVTYHRSKKKIMEELERNGEQNESKDRL